MLGLKNEEILTCLMLVLIGYFIAKMFSRSCNGFSVGGQCDLGQLEILNESPNRLPPLESECRNIGCGFQHSESTGGACKDCEEQDSDNCNNIHNCRFDSGIGHDRLPRCIFETPSSGQPVAAQSDDCTQILNNVYTNCPDHAGSDALTDECCSTLNAVLDNQNRCREWPIRALDIVNKNILRCP